MNEQTAIEIIQLSSARFALMAATSSLHAAIAEINAAQPGSGKRG